MPMSHRALNRASLARQMLLARESVPVVRAVERLLALQAQVPRPPHVALWTRVAAFERAALIAPLQERRLIRATTMRGTLHIMATKDFLAFRGALQPQLTAGVAAVVGKTPLPEVDALLAAARASMAKTHKTFNDIRADLVAAFPKHHDRLMGYYVRLHVPLVQVPTDDDVWGFPSDAAFALAERWLKTSVSTSPTPAAAQALVLRYLAAYGPATSQDIQAWTGLRGVAEILAALAKKLVTDTDPSGRTLYDVPNAPRPDEDTPAPPRFLPEYDSLVLAYADRARLIDEKFKKALVTKNLIVPATFLLDGRIRGTWKIETKGKTARLALAPFTPLTKKETRALDEEGERLVAFVNGL